MKNFSYLCIPLILLLFVPVHSSNRESQPLPQCLRIDLDAAPTVGFAPLFVRFNSLTESAEVNYFWDFGDGKTGSGRNPVHRYDKPGDYTITLTLTRDDELSIMEYKNLITVYDDSSHRGRCNLKIHSHSHTYPKEGWENSIDGDTYKENGTTTAGQDPAWVIYAFEDDKILTINKVRLTVETHSKFKSNWINRFRVSVSVNGTYFTEFTPVLEADRTTSTWETFEFKPVAARYVKLEILDPYEHWCQLGEFEVYEKVDLPDLTNAIFSVQSTALADSLDACLVRIDMADALGKPVTGLPSSAFRIIASGELFAQTMVIETGTPGEYQGAIRSFFPGEKEISVEVYGQAIGTPARTFFREPEYRQATLAFIHGTPCLNNQGWEKVIDGNWDGLEATTWAGPRFKDAWALFQFADSAAHFINKLRVITDTGLQKKPNLTTKYQIWISASDTVATSFRLFHEAIKEGGGWEEYKFLPTEIKFLKLVLQEPRQNFRIFGEFELYGPAEIQQNQRNPGTRPKRATPDAAMSAQTIRMTANYPNPFNPSTKIVYELTTTAEISLSIFNLKGELVRKFSSPEVTPGLHETDWDGRDAHGFILPSGYYWARLQAQSSGRVEIKAVKMMLLK